jgi:hypothetical protein
MRKENKALQDRVDESLLEAAQRLDAMNTKVWVYAGCGFFGSFCFLFSSSILCTCIVPS